MAYFVFADIHSKANRFYVMLEKIPIMIGVLLCYCVVL